MMKVNLIRQAPKICLIIGLLALVCGCEMMLPAPSLDPWRYPDSELSENDCPNFSGIYDGMGLQSVLPNIGLFVGDINAAELDGYIFADDIVSHDSSLIFDGQVIP